ncbi:MAG TPA: hypothetical protein DCQ64_20045 [Candidatus Rokubacteria bacterium]|nr:hypothetical protein [Candidatus Rokubacteria bacterium]
MSEAYGCLPSAAAQELETDPERRAVLIIQLRHFARVRAQLEAATSEATAPRGAMADLVMRVREARIASQEGGRG